MKRARRAAEALAVAVVLYFVAAYLAANWREVRSYPWDLAPASLVAATLVSGASLVGFGALWTALVRALGERIGLREGLPVWLVSNLARYIPGKVWQLSGMVYLARRRGLRAVPAVGASLLLQLLVLATGILILILTLPTEAAALGGSGLEIVLAAAAAAIVAFFLSPLFDAAYAKGGQLLKQSVPPERLSIRQKLLFGVGTLACWALYGAAFWLFVAGTAGRNLPFLTAVGICLAGYLGGFLAFFTPGGLGVREGLYTLLLGAYLPASVALAVALLARVWATLVELALAGLAVLVAGRGQLTFAASADAGPDA